MSSVVDNDNSRRSSATGGESFGVLGRKYLAAFSGDGARIFIQLFYFYLVANTLSLAEFGLFATASSVGIVLSRIAAFGFLSPLYRIATVKPHLIGVYSAGYAAAFALSVPVIAATGALVYWLLFSGQVSLAVFALIAGSEILFWRTLEVVITVNKGLEKFGRASLLIVFGFAMKAGAALVFAAASAGTLADWALIYFLTQAVMAAIAVVVFYPRRKWRLRPALYRRRIGDALSVSGAELLFYAQSELDKLVVLAAGGPLAAGIYAIIMRLVDLTAVPVRTFSTLLTQRLMRRPDLLGSFTTKILLEAGVFVVSTLAIGAMLAAFWVKPDILGTNVEEAAALLVLVLFVPAFRNLIEYQSELLYGRGQTFTRMVNYAIIGALKAVLLFVVMYGSAAPESWIVLTNAVFGILYGVSRALTYRALRRPAIRI